LVFVRRLANERIRERSIPLRHGQNIVHAYKQGFTRWPNNKDSKAKPPLETDFAIFELVDTPQNLLAETSTHDKG
jgi:hypothetical protein